MFESLYQPDPYIKILRNRIKLRYELEGMDMEAVEVLVALMSDETVIAVNRVLNERTQQQ